MGHTLKEEDGFVKVLAGPDDGEVLGCHILGPDPSTLIHEVVAAITAGDGTVSNIADAIHIHPALSEVVEGAFGDIHVQSIMSAYPAVWGHGLVGHPQNIHTRKTGGDAQSVSLSERRVAECLR